MKKFISIALALAMLFALAACGSSGSSAPAKTDTPAKTEAPAAAADSGDKTVLIGGLYPLTGSAASSGKTMQYGIDYAIKRINEGGGINGYKLNMMQESLVSLRLNVHLQKNRLRLLLRSIEK